MPPNHTTSQIPLVEDDSSDEEPLIQQGPHDGTVYAFTGVPNFRDAVENKITENGRPLRSRMLFRCATMDEASEADVNTIVKELDIHTVIDLRSSGESRAIHTAQHAIEGIPKVAEHYQLSPEPPIPDRFMSSPSRKRFTIDFMQRLRRYIWGSLDICTKLTFLALSLVCQHNAARRLVIQNSFLSRDGLYGLNKAILDQCGRDIKLIMDILAHDQNYPVLIHCTAGKDRTGLTIALVHGLLGVKRDQIVADYTRSKDCLKSHMGRMVAEMGKHGMSEEFTGCPPEVMERTLRYIDAQFGSTENYLESVGVGLDEQEKIRRILQTGPAV
ncbi:hypothetical protein HK097_009248 [Rhizophlyctis rosea]|uniref:Tyrosine specific protein phosphatases domain-containing protein n=1 Tax=Rhizophlyctis rosea TaxID=64517 RepID=A0AAD5SK69_9FUNG|nr:hypothetical protein HK097_009248 [Rhizophlyctis rosea]